MGIISEEQRVAAGKKLTALYGRSEGEAILRILKQDFTEQELFENAVRRVLNGEPVQYVSGYTDFLNCRIAVDPSVLIPRPETEEMVCLILKENPGPVMRVLDMGTGSGCISVALARARPLWQVVASDVSSAALRLAVKNAADNRVDVEFWLHDILQKDPGFLPRELDVLVSNPPYITMEESAEMENLVLDHEPALALFVTENDPLQFYRALAAYGLILLKSGGQIWMECNAKYTSEIKDFFETKGYRCVSIRKDLSGKDRFIHAYAP
ncbi:MAG: peptide chain release factor N(5)-glutamine methyltransferase [Bacteroidia bacterium]|nr:peptide chain release factor N(5)-glutamine methyltransferase [Bacteroidia bacterium]